MQSYLDTKFPYYPNDIRIVKPLGYITVREFIRAVSNPKEEVKQLFLDVKVAADKGDLKLKGELKKKLYYFTPCVDTDGLGRGYKNITSFQGIVQIDFDGITNAVDFRDWFFENVSSCILCGVSPSGYGIKALVRIPIVQSVDEYKEYYYGMAHYLEKFKGFDGATQNPCLPLYMFYDPGLRWREDATISYHRGIKVNAFDKNKMVNLSDYEGGEESTYENKLRISNYIKYKIENIDGNAYPQILSLGTTIGGLISYYSLDLDAVVDYTNGLIEENAYMQKSLKAYKKGFYDCALQGLQSPWSLEDSIDKKN